MAPLLMHAYVPPPPQHSVESGRLILRDGSTASIRVARPEDRDELLAFFERLSPPAKRRRFFAAALPPAELIASLCKVADPRVQVTLLVQRMREGAPRIIAAGSYQRITENTAEVAFAVEDAFQGKGLGTILLERLAFLAVRHGIVRFWAVTHPDNLAMRDVFRDSGFPCVERLEGGELEVDLTVMPTEASVARHGPSTPANHQEWLLALTEFTSALSDIQRLNNESVHEKLHEIAGRLHLKLRSSGAR